MKIARFDVHNEVVGNSTVPVLHPVNTDIHASQSVVKLNGSPVCCEDDTFECNHTPQLGTFATPPMNQGKLSDAGQSLVKINGKCVATLSGFNRSCDDSGVEELSNQQTIVPDEKTPLKINGSPVVSGR